jgi:la-related protein 1
MVSRYCLTQSLLKTLNNKSQQTQSKQLLEVANYLKKSAKVQETMLIYSIYLLNNPANPNVWLEKSKLEDEFGLFKESTLDLRVGLKFCPNNEALLEKFIHVKEKTNDVKSIRQILNEMADLPVEKIWKPLIDAAMLESKCANVSVCRKIFKLLCSKLKQYGPIFLEYSKFEEKCGNIDKAFDVCEEGINNNAYYAPLWIQLIKLCGKSRKSGKYGDHSQLLHEALTSLSREIWSKLYMESAMSIECKEEISLCKKRLVNAFIYSPENLKWKIFILGARIEIRYANCENALSLLNQCVSFIPSKQQGFLLIEYAKYYEMKGVMDKAAKMYEEAIKIDGSNWKTWFEHLQFYMRCNNLNKALDVTDSALEIHSNTGRLYASLIQIMHIKAKTTEDYLAAYEKFKSSCAKIPKSGEVWCEGARLVMNSKHPKYNLAKAKKYLEYALHFTPQYGDSFIEMMKLAIHQCDGKLLKETKYKCLFSEPNYGSVWFYGKNTVNDSAYDVWVRAKSIIMADIKKSLAAGEKCYSGVICFDKYNKIFKGETKPTYEEKYKLLYGFEPIGS